MAKHVEEVVVDQLEPGGRTAAPGRLALVQRFINTWNCEFPTDRDRLATPRSAAAWLHENKLVSHLAEANRFQPCDLARLRGLREAVRALATTNVTGSRVPAALDVIRSAAAGASMIVTIDDVGGTHLDTGCSGVDGVVARLLAILHDAQLAGDWARLKGCRQCGYAFFDLSKNRSATWCSMSICGNRSKNRAYYQRHRTKDPPSEAPLVG